MTKQNSNRKKSKTEKTTNTDLSTELLDLYDDYARFTQRCIFLCDAASNLMANNEELSKESIRGFEQYAGLLRHETLGFKKRIGEIRTIYSSTNR